eukprot:scaffold114153_cov69-Phaeocystis_antarctica.AAC.4
MSRYFSAVVPHTLCRTHGLRITDMCMCMWCNAKANLRSSGPDAARVIERPLLQRTHALRLRGDKGQFLAIAAEHHQGWHAAAAPKAQPQGLRARPNLILLLEVVGLLVWHLQRVQALGACLRSGLVAVARYIDDSDGLTAVLAGL